MPAYSVEGAAPRSWDDIAYRGLRYVMKRWALNRRVYARLRRI